MVHYGLVVFDISLLKTRAGYGAAICLDVQLHCSPKKLTSQDDIIPSSALYSLFTTKGSRAEPVEKDEQNCKTAATNCKSKCWSIPQTMDKLPNLLCQLPTSAELHDPSHVNVSSHPLTIRYCDEMRLRDDGNG
jgi:hypothetical protein